MVGVPNQNLSSVKIKMKYLYLSKSKIIPYNLKDMFDNDAFKKYYSR